jgi:hypothetical protein
MSSNCCIGSRACIFLISDNSAGVKSRALVVAAAPARSFEL